MCYLNWDTSTPQLEQNELAVCVVGSEKDVFVVRVVNFIREREKKGKEEGFFISFSNPNVIYCIAKEENHSVIITN